MKIKTSQIAASMNGNVLEIFVDNSLTAEVFGGRTDPYFVYDILWWMGYEIHGFEEAERQ